MPVQQLLDTATNAAKNAIGSLASQVTKGITKKIDELTDYQRLKWPTELGTLENLHWLEIRGYTFGVDTKLKNEPDNSSGKTDGNEPIKSLCQIMLPVPDSINFNYSPQWEVAGLAELDAAKSAFDYLKSRDGSIEKAMTDVGADVSSGNWKQWYVSALALRASGTMGKALTGYAPNPRKQSMFSGIDPRTFTFSWNLTPKTAKECQDIQNILKTLKFHSLPEEDGQFVFKFPSQFRLTFYHRGVVNTNLPLMAYTVITGISCNYTGAGMWAALKNGHPLDIQLTLNFMETEIITRQKAAQGY